MDTIEELKILLVEATSELERRNHQFELIKSGGLGRLLGMGLWITGITYLIAGLRLTEETVPLSAFGIETPLFFWQVLYSFTLVTATWLWFKPRDRIVYLIHWLIPTINLTLTTVALAVGGFFEVLSGRSGLTEQVLSQQGLLGNALFTGYILLSQYTFLRLSVLLKDGKPY